MHAESKIYTLLPAALVAAVGAAAAAAGAAEPASAVAAPGSPSAEPARTPTNDSAMGEYVRPAKLNAKTR